MGCSSFQLPNWLKISFNAEDNRLSSCPARMSGKRVHRLQLTKLCPSISVEPQLRALLLGGAAER
jgi:hypothetical protein